VNARHSRLSTPCCSLARRAGPSGSYTP
jgi:hypothetical protein